MPEAANPNGQPSNHPKSMGGNPGLKIHNNKELKEPSTKEIGISFEDSTINQEAQASTPLTKDVLVELLAKLESSLKIDIAVARADLGQVLNRVQEAEERLDIHDQVMEVKRDQIRP